MPGTAAFGLGGHEGLQVAADQGLHHGMLRTEGLQQHLAGRLRTSGATGNLMQQLYGPLRRAQVAAGQSEVGIHHANEGEVREVPALGDDLGADDKVHLAALDHVGSLGGGVRTGHGVAGHH